MSWTKFFDKIYVINLKHRDDRLLQVKWEMDKYGVPFEVWPGILQDDGRVGIMLAFKSLFLHATMSKYKNILVFEDDARFLKDPQPVMERAIAQLPSDYDMMYLGVNLTKSYTPKFYSHNLLHLQRGLALHACAYSNMGMEKMCSLSSMVPIDLNVADTIHPQGKSYAVFPMLVTQRPSRSDIEKKEKDWSYALENRFYEQVCKNADYKNHII